MPEGPLHPTHDGVCVAIRLTPRAKRNRIVAVVPTAAAGRVVKASVTAPADNGRANEALLQMLANAWRVPRRDLAIVAGTTSRHKMVRVSGDPLMLIERFSALTAALPGP